MQFAEKFKGVKEVKGKRHNPQIVRFFELVGHAGIKDDETAWCAAFVGACLTMAGLPHTHSLAARSYLQYGTKLNRPKPGCIVVFRRGRSKWQGHVAFYVDETDTHVKVLGGNQSNQVRISSYAKSQLLGYRWPKSNGASRTIKAAAGAKGALVSAVGIGGSEQALTEQLYTWQGLAEWMPWAKYVLIGIAVLLLLRVVWAKADDNATNGAPDTDMMAELEGA
jgi:uncharacterized protein (TIGR02594 family)